MNVDTEGDGSYKCVFLTAWLLSYNRHHSFCSMNQKLSIVLAPFFSLSFSSLSDIQENLHFMAGKGFECLSSLMHTYSFLLSSLVSCGGLLNDSVCDKSHMPSLFSGTRTGPDWHLRSIQKISHTWAHEIQKFHQSGLEISSSEREEPGLFLSLLKQLQCLFFPDIDGVKILLKCLTWLVIITSMRYFSW